MSTAIHSSLVSNLTKKVLPQRHRRDAWANGFFTKAQTFKAIVFVVCFALLSNLNPNHLQAEPPAQADQANVDIKETFYQKLVKAAHARTKHVVIYNPKYFAIPYPGGDVPAHFGVCTDVIIRAYRDVGIDLQKQVHRTMGGDKNIAHRRVRVMRKFFTKKGASLKVSQTPQDYKPGDLVSYHIPNAVFSQDHIAIVSDKRGISGNLMIVHNIGLGPKLDDDLMSYKITGHYRYGG